MRLRQLKVSGFKSFADTTLIEFPGNMAGIVGPNGCGKSNVIDAIRWVLGEGRISELRGSSSMSELIFSGSSSRPASSRASVEMVLDNSDNTITGPWGAYTELSIKRVVTRDGSNAYLINNQQVRRRDVQDVFMGTGLGPRSYAIISQGMISNFIKAKPEELRIYLEEAAGVSKYKERRRETETALNSTRDNLQKVAYLQETKKAEIERLSQEAQTAQKWEELEKERVDADLLSHFLQEKESKEASDKISARIAKKETEILSAQGEGQKLLIEIEALKEASLAKREATDVARQVKFEAEKAVAQIEGDIRHIVERKDSINRQIASDEERSAERKAAFEGSSEREKALLEHAATLEAQAAETEAALEAMAEDIEAASAHYEDARQTYESARTSASEAENKIAVVNVEMQSFEREITDAETRLASLREEMESVQEPDTERFKALDGEIEQAQATLEEQSAAFEDESSKKEALQEKLVALTDQKNTLSADLARVSSRLQTLESLQAKIGQEGKLSEWIHTMGFGGVKRLFERIEVDPHYTKAVEAILNHKSGALSIKDAASVAALESTAPPAPLVFFGETDFVNAKSAEIGLKHLMEFVQSDDAMVKNALSAWFADVYVAENLSEAIQKRGELKTSERIVTAAGHIVDPFSITFWAEENEASGALSRAQEIRELSEKEEEIKSQLESVADDEGVKRGEVATLAASLESMSAAIDSERTRLHELQVESTRLAGEIELWNTRTKKAAEDTQLLEGRLEQLTEEREAVEAKFEALDAALGEKQQAVTDAQILLEQAEHRVSDLEEAASEKKSEVKMARLQATSDKERAEDAKREAESITLEIERLANEIEELRTELQGLDVKAQEAGLSDLTRALEAARESLKVAEHEAEAAENTLEEARAKQREIAESQAPILQEISDLKVKRQTFLTQGEAFTAHLNELNANREALAKRVIEENLKTPAVKAKVTRLTEAIAALGPVNHAALENLEASQKAMAETERQVADLEEAIANLEETIKKIDAETRELLRTTFETVNKNFGEMFTSLFGGGSAELRLTGEEILDTGIDVIAQPPGKKNTSVKILSGGEQALTATALVFAIFKLNPAPFCLLDEVDAPLDEANQDRLVKKIAAMSKATQFVMITHHRVSMEQLEQLIGVTMKEPGVSRVVAVDIREATQLAQS